VVHRRTVVRAGDDIWIVIDDVLGTGTHSVRGGWLLPDAEWSYEKDELNLALAQDRLKIRMPNAECTVGLYRAGVRIAGEEVSGEGGLWGWHSLTYGVKKSALRWVYERNGMLPLRLETWWSFNDAHPMDATVHRHDPHLGTCAVAALDYKGVRLDIDDAHLVDPSSLR
jgi:hypothetical protein